MSEFYSRLNAKRGDDVELTQCIERVVNQLSATNTSMAAPGMLLGKIQSGKTRGFLGVIAKGFDRGFDIAIVLTKGTKTLVRQTVQRIESEFEEFIEDEQMLLFDVMHMPQEMTKSERRRKMIIVAKKQSQNLDRLLELFNVKYPELKDRKVLLVDDEADMASVRFVKNKDKRGRKRDDRAGDLAQGSIAQQMDDLRASVLGMAFLQVTATPYALYLQPEQYPEGDAGFVFYPKRPAFTELLPIHGGYVGGDDYFGDFSANDPRSSLFVLVPEDEQNALRGKDGRQIRADRYWTSKNVAALRRSLMTFLLAVALRRWQQTDQGEKPKKYAMILHNDTQRAAHTWQFETVTGVLAAFEAAVENADERLVALFNEAYADLSSSVKANKGQLPSSRAALNLVKGIIDDGEFNIQRVNSDQDLATLLDPRTAELKLRTQANIFIGGSILDRGITVPNLISFYYGRNPKRMQADTVLQHSRMYGNRDRRDLAVTRFFTSKLVRDRLETIHNLEAVLRDAFARGNNDDGVVFIQKDAKGGVVPCAPSKILASEIVSVKANDLYLPTGFDTSKSRESKSATGDLSERISALEVADSGDVAYISPEAAVELLRLSARALSPEMVPAFNWNAMEALLLYYAKSSGKVGVLAETGRALSRTNSGDKSGLSILGGGKLRAKVRDELRAEPLLVFLKQEGSKRLEWTGDREFWWPLLAVPSGVQTCVFATGAIS